MGQQKQKDIHTPKYSRLWTLLKEFIQSEKAKGKRQSWISALPHRVGKLLDYLEENSLDLTDLTIRTAQEYTGMLTASKRKNRTTAVYLVAAGAFCRHLKTRGLLSGNPFAEIRKPKTERTLPAQIPKEKQLADILFRLNQWEQAGNLRAIIRMYRIHVLAELQYAAGLRISEAAGLQVQDVDLERGLIHVHNGKGGYDRVCFLNEYCVRVLKLYIQRIRPLVCSVWNKDSDRLFNTGRVWWFGHSVNEALRKIGAQEGFPNFTSHTLRHALGYHLLRAGAPIRSIQQILGHRRLRNTEVYTKVDKEDLKSVLDAKHPRQWRQMC